MKIATVFFVIIFIYGCSQKPDDSLIRQHVIKQNDEQYNTLGLGKIVEIKNFKVANGLLNLKSEPEVYTAFVQYDFIFLKDPNELVFELRNMMNRRSAGENVGGIINNIARGAGILETLLQMALSNGPGKSNIVQETITLKKGDRGWFATDTQPGWQDNL